MDRLAGIMLLACCVLLCDCANAATVPTKSYRAWRATLIEDAISDGVSADTVHAALDDLMPDDKVLALDQKQPEKTITFDDYAKGIVSLRRVNEGIKLRDDNADVLKEVSNKYGVPKEVIVALWGIESNFGKNTGNFSVVRSLLTLAYEGRRAEFFRGELFAALHILDEEKMAAYELRGSWAGAMGQCQFMPSTYRKHAVDFNGDGKRDIWDDTDDVLASIANYIVFEGWQSRMPWGEEVTLSKHIPKSEIGLATHHSLLEWKNMGVNVSKKVLAANPSIEASLVQPDGADGRSFLVYDSFRALMKWNRSTYFATAVGLLADRIRQ